MGGGAEGEGGGGGLLVTGLISWKECGKTYEGRNGKGFIIFFSNCLRLSLSLICKTTSFYWHFRGGGACRGFKFIEAPENRHKASVKKNVNACKNPIFPPKIK